MDNAALSVASGIPDSYCETAVVKGTSHSNGYIVFFWAFHVMCTRLLNQRQVSQEIPRLIVSDLRDSVVLVKTAYKSK